MISCIKVIWRYNLFSARLKKIPFLVEPQQRNKCDGNGEVNYHTQHTHGSKKSKFHPQPPFLLRALHPITLHFMTLVLIFLFHLAGHPLSPAHSSLLSSWLSFFFSVLTLSVPLSLSLLSSFLSLFPPVPNSQFALSLQISITKYVSFLFPVLLAQKLLPVYLLI